MKTALTIAGSDPTGGAGMQADLKTFSAMGVYGLSVPAVLTAQNSLGVLSIHELTADFFAAQLDVLLQDIRPDALKTGMMYSTDLMKTAGETFRKYSLHNIVVDPIIASSTGVRLVEEGALEIMKNTIFPCARIITPNIYEASLFTGGDITEESNMKDAAVTLRGLGPEVVIITGGHLKDAARDVLYDGKEFVILDNERLEGDYHGTGCVFSAALAACLALGCDVKEAFIRAKSFVWTAMKSAVSIGRGMKILRI